MKMGLRDKATEARDAHRAAVKNGLGQLWTASPTCLGCQVGETQSRRPLGALREARTCIETSTVAMDAMQVRLLAPNASLRGVCNFEAKVHFAVMPCRLRDACKLVA